MPRRAKTNTGSPSNAETELRRPRETTPELNMTNKTNHTIMKKRTVLALTTRPAILLVLLTLNSYLPFAYAQNTWNLDGNFVSPGQFLGSTNFEAVELKAGGMRVLRLEPDARTNIGGLSGNLIGGFIG